MAVRGFHRWVGLTASGLGLALAITGAVLAVEPVFEAAQTGSLMSVPDVSVATIAEAAVQQIDGVERIEKTANHTVWVHFSDASGFGKVAFDPISLAPIPTTPSSSIWAVVKDFHRALFMGDFGRLITGTTALAMLILTISGLYMLVHRLGGWRALIAPLTSGKTQKRHLDMGRIAAFGLLVASTTGLAMSLATFDIIPSDPAGFAQFPTIDITQPALAIADLTALQDTPLAELRELVMPYPNDPSDPYTLSVHAGEGFVDPTSGGLVGFSNYSLASQIYEFIYLLHTGQGAWLVGVLLGASMLAVPAVILSGITMALRRPRIGKRSIKTVPAQSADTIVLVGSEGATTWGFAGELCRKLSAAGKRVHVGDLNDLGTAYPAAKHLFILTATYGQGEAPSNAAKFFDRLPNLMTRDMDYTVLGFGDRSFAEFCQFAKDVDAACRAHGLNGFVRLTEIDRQSSQSFQTWGQQVGAALGIRLDLHHRASTPKTTKTHLHDRVDYGQEVQAPVSILRLTTKGKLPRHAPGDLLGVLVPGSDVPRFYSLASCHKDGVIEICVRKQNGGLCSSFLTAMTKGDAVDVFIKPNPDFRPSKAKTPLLLIGAGAGIGPLIGFARANPSTRPAAFFWGGRHPGSDYLYRDELTALKKAGRITQVTTAFSRLSGGVYVQEKLRGSAEELREAIMRGGQVMVCGGSMMGAEVRAAWDDILAPLGLSVQQLKLQKRYIEDVY